MTPRRRASDRARRACRRDWPLTSADSRNSPRSRPRLELLAGQEDSSRRRRARRAGASGWSPRPRAWSLRPGSSEQPLARACSCPSPTAPETTTRWPGRSPQPSIHMRQARSAAKVGSFDVLDQLADLLQEPLDLDHGPADLDVVGLRADRVGLAAHLLDDELELPARALGLVRSPRRTGPGGPGAGRSPRRCRPARRGWRPRGSGPSARSSPPGPATSAWTRSSAASGRRRRPPGPRSATRSRCSRDRPAEGEQLVGHRPALLGPGLLELAEGLGRRPRQGGPVLVRVVDGRLPLLDHAGQRRAGRPDRRPRPARRARGAGRGSSPGRPG